VSYRRLWAEVEDRLDLQSPATPVIDLTRSPSAAPGASPGVVASATAEAG
jgi:hypothetical protein